MSDFAALVLSQFLLRLDILVIINVRILAFVLVLPALSSSSIPNLVKLIFSLSISFLLFSTNQIETVNYINSVPGFVSLLVSEFVVGFTLAFVVYLIFSVMYLAGQLIDYQIGFSMLSVLDPFTQIQVPVTGNLLYFMMAALMIQSGALQVFITALFVSFEKIPPGTQFLWQNDRLFTYIVNLLGTYLELGMRVAMPIIGCIILIDIALGILVKSVPQMNVFVVGMPIKLLIGLVILYITVPGIASMIDTLYNMSNKALENVIGGLSP